MAKIIHLALTASTMDYEEEGGLLPLKLIK